jgi:hypothetical protein
MPNLISLPIWCGLLFTCVASSSAESILPGSRSQAISPAPGRFGPKRTDPTQGIPKHAYSPFEDIGKPPAYTPAPDRDYPEGELVIKLAPNTKVDPAPRVAPAFNNADLSGRANVRRLTDSDSLNQALAAEGITELRPVFRDAKPPTAKAAIGQTAGPDLTRWYRARSKNTTREAIEKLVTDPAISIVEPNYIESVPKGRFLGCNQPG